ncbi:COG3686 Predicted membrane protein [Comamonadaceae bacterium]
MTALQALVGFALWTLALITLVFLYRGLRFLRGTPINHWPRGNKPQDDASVVKRLEDAHANCMENLPVFAVLVLAASLMDKSNTIQTIAPFVLYARIGQTLAHLWGTGTLQVFVRASFWSVQLVICLWMAIQLLAA